MGSGVRDRAVSAGSGVSEGAASESADAAVPSTAAGLSGATAPPQDEDPEKVTTVPQGRPATPAGGRPADAAREALRAARREALRTEADEAARPRTRAAAPPTPSASAAAPASRAARLKAVQDMRHYLANAFRMPAWSDTPEEETGTVGVTEGAESPSPVPAEPHPSAERPEPRTPDPASPDPRRSVSGSAPPDSRPLPASMPPDFRRPLPASGTPRPPGLGPRHGDQGRSPGGVGGGALGPDAGAGCGGSALGSDAGAGCGGSALGSDGGAGRGGSALGSDAGAGRGGSAPGPDAGAGRGGSAPGPDAGAGRGGPAATAPHVPPTMATPHRDTELRRTFPAFPPREAGAEGAPFAGTWWGNAWVAALEQGALDPKRLARGRGYADQGHVDAITVTPGLVLAYVRGSRPRPYRVQMRVRTLEDEDWARFLDAAADRPGHIAALLDKELPQSLADCGVPLLPGPGDLAPRCSCPDSGHPCKHAAALCYQTARLLDADPFVLLLLRGRGEKDLLDALSRRSAARAARAAQERQPRSLPGVRAADALAPRELPPLPPPLPAPAHPEQPPVYPAAPGGPDPFALDQLATDAAARAHALLGTGRDPVGELTLWQDAVRLAAARPGSGLTATTRTLYATLATAADRTPADLARAVAAWRQGGLAGLTVLEEPWDPPAGRFDRARPLLLAADLPAFRPWRNRLTHPRGHVQLRLGRDGLWYAYESEPGQDDWWPRGTPDLDPVGALTGLGAPDDA
nr:SWIM zinc finger family protein [Streptomyces fodineus]